MAEITFEGQVDVDTHRDAYLAGIRELKSNGLFTVSHPDVGRRTFRIGTEIWNEHKPNEATHRIISYLGGPDNLGDYFKFGFVREGNIEPWKKFRYSPIIDWSQVLLSLVNGAEMPGWSLHAASRCCMCGRTLTVPSSVEMGIGPVCAGRA